jgi:cytoplasmic iron level regulating protein YaaA (DUF328/UPF0246 family)
MVSHPSMFRQRRLLCYTLVMKIIYSPTKTMQFKTLYPSSCLPSDYYKPILAQLQQYSAKKLARMFDCSDSIARAAYESFQGFEGVLVNAAIHAYTGLSYQALRLKEYDASQWHYAEETIRIIDAFYGVLTPLTGIKPYRLDFHTPLQPSLYSRWKFTLEEPIINLASQEYASAINQPMISIEFYEDNKGTLTNKATYAKMARGSMLDFCITNKIKTPKQLQSFDLLGYQYSKNHSTSSTYVFVRNEKKPK